MVMGSLRRRNRLPVSSQFPGRVERPILLFTCSLSVGAGLIGGEKFDRLMSLFPSAAVARPLIGEFPRPTPSDVFV